LKRFDLFHHQRAGFVVIIRRSVSNA